MILILPLQLVASGLQISNLKWESSTELSIDLSWDHSWFLDSGATNHDAVWLFGKIRQSGSTDWEHLMMLTATCNPDFKASISSDAAGLMLRRDVAGSGLAECALVIELSNPFSGPVDVQIHGCEMVFVPQGGFWLGDAASTNSLADGGGNPFKVDSETEIPVGSGNLTSLAAYPPSSTLPADYPKGFQGFYAMKYELSQQAYVNMLNTLSWPDQQLRTNLQGDWAFDPDDLHRNGIRMMIPGGTEPAVFACDANRNGTANEDEDGGDRAVNGLNWDDVIAWLDWAALRPMTELEFEKMSRGPRNPVAGEFAWGTDLVVDANTPVDDGMSTEHVSEAPAPGEGLASHGYFGPQGPLRNGFAASMNSNRLQAGSSYWGIMELSGNLWELCVSVLDPGLGFDGQHGDGTLSAGAADTPGWPTADGAGFRGGAWNSGIGPVGTFRDLATSDRWYAGLPPDTRRFTIGARGVRTWEP